MTLCQECCDTGCCRACGGRGSKPCAESRDSKRQCAVCIGSGKCIDCRGFDPVDPAALYARALLQMAGGLRVQFG